jgi:hypothetical protein
MIGRQRELVKQTIIQNEHEQKYKLHKQTKQVHQYMIDAPAPATIIVSSDVVLHVSGREEHVGELD